MQEQVYQNGYTACGHLKIKVASNAFYMLIVFIVDVPNLDINRVSKILVWTHGICSRDR